MTTPADSSPPSGLAIASLVLGILSLVLGFLVVGIFPALVGVVLAAVALRQSRQSTMAAWGLATSAVGLVLSVAMLGLIAVTVWQKGLGTRRHRSRPEVSEIKMGLKPAERPLVLEELWSLEIPGATAVTAGDLDGNGRIEVLVAAAGRQGHRVSADGRLLGTHPLAGEAAFLELGRAGDGGARLAAYENWGKRVLVMNAAGERLWAHSTPSGVDGAHWGDLDGDGADELVVGLNGGGGLTALSPAGEPLWSDTQIGNVWNQAVVSLRGTQPARVFTTEAGGRVRVYESSGKLLRRFELDGEYCAPMSAARMDASGRIQVIGEVDDDTVAASDEQGQTVWRTPVSGSAGHWRQRRFVALDVDGDGTREWIFRQDKDHLVVASPDGIRRAELRLDGPVDEIAVLPMAGGDRLLTRQKDRLAAHGIPAPSAAR